MKKILITGGAGLIGSHLVEYFIANTDDEITIVDNFSRGRRDKEFEDFAKNKRVKCFDLDLTLPESWEKLPREFDEIYHLAAINGTQNFYDKPAEVLRVNTLATVYLLEWLRLKNLKPKLLFTSSCESYTGGLEAFGKLEIPTPETVPLVISDPLNKRWSYAGSKIINELFIINYARQYGFPALIVRPHNFYGPRDWGEHVIPDFIKRVMQKIDPFPIKGGDNTRSFLYIADGVEAMYKLMREANWTGVEIVNIGSAKEITMTELAETLFAVVGWRPRELAITEAPAGSTKRRQGDMSKLKTMINWSPITSLSDGLRLTYKWWQWQSI